MNKFEELARKGLEEQQRAKAARDEEAAQRKSRAEERFALARSLLDEHVSPVLTTAVKGFQKANVEASFADGGHLVHPSVTMTVGHNRVGMTGSRIAILRVWADGDSLLVQVDSQNGPVKDWKSTAATIAADLDEAIEDGLNRWLERGYPKKG